MTLTAYAQQRQITAAEPKSVRPLKILGWAGDKFGCGNYRIGMPMWAMSMLGHDASAFYSLENNLPADLDVLVGQRISDGYPAQFWLETALHPMRRFGMVYEIDDDLWNLDPSNPQAVLYRRPDVIATMQRCIAVADAVTVTTAQLAEVIAQFNANVVVIENCLDRSVFEFIRPANDKVTVGWAGSPTHLNDFESVRPQLSTFFRKNPEIDSHFIGVNYGALIGRQHGRYSEWQANLNDYLQLLDFDIGIAPLQFTRFNRSKSDVKFLEYSSRAIPIVASHYGPYAQSIEHGVTGLLAKHPHEWTKYLRQLANDPEMRAEIGAKARAWASARTVQANAWRWEQVYRSVAP